MTSPATSPPATSALSITELLLDVVDRQPTAIALRAVKDGKTIEFTWGEVGDWVWRWGGALVAGGVQPGDRVAHWSENRLEWVIIDLAIQAIGAIHVPIHATLSGRQVADQIEHSEAVAVIFSGKDQADALAPHVASVGNALGKQPVWISYDTVRARQLEGLSTMASMAESVDVATGRQYVEQQVAKCDPDLTTTILYSSGTTGQPKGVELTQANLVSNAIGLANSFGEQPLETRLNFLPLSHIFGRTCDLYSWIVRGSILALTQNRDTIIDDCKRFHPTLINGVPYFFERVHQKIVENGKGNDPGALKRVLGGEIRGCFSGGAALDNETFDFYEQQGVPLMQGYGLTETSPVVALSTLENIRRGTVGRPLTGVEVRIAADGEILTRGPHLMKGYWKEPDATAEAIRGGWLHTGDLGALDDDGYLRITGRKKEIIVTATGKNIFPTHLESLLCRDPLIIQAIVIGDDRKYLSALIVPDPDVLKAEIKKRRLWVWSKRRAVTHPKIVKLYEQRIAAQLSQLADYEQIKRFLVLDRGFLPENGHLTPKLSLRRDLIHKDFAKEIESLYE